MKRYLSKVLRRLLSSQSALGSRISAAGEPVHRENRQVLEIQLTIVIQIDLGTG
jgi:hypothetical protein